MDQEQGSGKAYYPGVRFQIYARDLAGTEYFLVDGGFTDWTRQWLSNRKERLLIGGMSSEEQHHQGIQLIRLEKCLLSGTATRSKTKK
jgi:hypothetical protein